MATKKTTSTKKTAKTTSTKAKAAKAKKASTTTTKAKAEKKLSQFQAAIKVLAQAKEPMNTKQVIETMLAKGLWASPAGKTPSQTLYASILRDLGRYQRQKSRPEN